MTIIDIDRSEPVRADVEGFEKPVLLGPEANELATDSIVITRLEENELEN